MITIVVSLHLVILSSQRELFNRKLDESQRIGKIVMAIMVRDMQLHSVHDFQTYLNMLPLGEDISNIRVFDSKGELKYSLGDSINGVRFDKYAHSSCRECHISEDVPAKKLVNLKRYASGELIFQADYPLENTVECRKCHDPSLPYLGNFLTELKLTPAELRQVNRRKIMIFAGMAVMLSAVGYIGLYFQYRIVKPIKNMVRVIERSKKGELDERMKVKRNDEIGYLGTSYNEMMDSLQELQNSLESQVESRTRELESSRTQLLFRENLAALGRLAAGIAHELGNPLTGISSIVQLLKRRKKDDAYLVEQLNLVHEEINRLTRLSRQLVDLARPEDSRTAMFNVKASVLKAYQIARLDRRLKKCSVNLPEDEEPVFALVNEDALIQIMMNLLFNAADATGEGGIIRIDIEEKEGSIVEIRVHDNGTGIPEEMQHRIFDPFYSGKTPGSGTGLGLSVSHSLARSFKGELMIESSSEKGTTFLLKIPTN